jgi:hypothetical protein
LRAHNSGLGKNAAVEAVIAKWFGQGRTPSLVAGVSTSKLPVVFTHLGAAEAPLNRWLFRVNSEPMDRLHRRLTT